MHTIWIPHTDETIEYPEYMDELTNEQYLFYCKMVCAFLSGEFTFQEIKILLACKMLNIEFKEFKDVLDNDTRNENFYRISETLDSLFKIDQQQDKTLVSPEIGFLDNKLPKITINNIDYYGPADMFSNLTFKEHMHCLYQYECYRTSKNETYLDELLSILYRPKKAETQHNSNSNYDGDIRQPYYPAKSESLVEEFSTLEFYYKFAVYLWFQSVQDYLCTARDIDVLGVKCDFSVLFQESKSKIKGIGMPGVLLSLTKTGAIGTKKETEDEMYLFILVTLYQQHLDAENLKQQQKDAKNR